MTLTRKKIKLELYLHFFGVNSVSIAMDMKQRIVKMALNLFLEKGFSGVKVEEISEALLISKKTIYNHFQNKHELYLASASYYMEKAVSRMEEIALSTKLDFHHRISKLLEFANRTLSEAYCFDDMREVNQHLANLVLFPHIREKFRSILNILIQEGKQNDIIRKDLPQSIFINSLLILIISQYDKDKRDLSFQAPAAFSCFIEEIIFKGILTDEGKKKFT